MNESSKKILVAIAFILFSILILGGFYLFTSPEQTANIAFAYVVGLSMIVLPCTLPLAFVIVPMAMSKGPKKGLLMSIYFGLGISITLAIYGLFIGFIGQTLGLDKAIGGASSISRIIFIIGGLSAFIFGLSELNLIKFKIPTYGGSYPKIIQNQGDYLKAFFLGLFLGNAGVGCPNPLFYVLLGDIAVTGSMATGAWLGFIHGVGRATPLIFLAILGILGVNSVSKIASKTVTVTKITGISLIILGAIIFIMGTSHSWYESTGIHREWNNTIQVITGGSKSNIVERGNLPEKTNSVTKSGNKPVPKKSTSDHVDSSDFIPAPWSWITLLGLIFIPLSIYFIRERKKKALSSE